MKRNLIVTAGFVLSGLLLASGMMTTPVEAQVANESRPTFLMLNVQKVFADYRKFQSLTEGLKSQLDSKEKQLMEMEQQVKSKADSIQQMTNQDDRDNVQREIADLKFEYEKTRRDARTQFLAKEAEIYATVYGEMHQMVEAYCQQHKYLVVFRVQDHEPKDTSTPNAILQTLNREVVYHHPNLDLTQVIVDGLNQQFDKQARNGAPAVK